MQTRARAEALEDPPRPHYAIDVELDPVRHEVEGSLRLHFQAGPVPLEAIWLQLYANGLKSSDSVYQRGRPLSPLAYGSIELHSLRIDGQERLADTQDELLPGDHTRLRLPLATPVAAGESVVLEIEFVTRLPALTGRSGHADDFHLVAQWYPKLAYLSPEGRFEPHPFQRQAEFRANHASYDLTVHAPKGFRVEAAGARMAAGEQGTWRFQSGPATDVAFAACQRCEATQGLHGQVTLRGLSAAGTEQSAARQLEVIRQGLDHLGQTLAPYPHSQLAVVTAPRGHKVGGMEYPGFVVLPAAVSPLGSSPFLDGRHVAAHELAHQWFYGLVSSDEVRFPVLDEGLTEWATCDLLRVLGADTAGLDPFASWRAITHTGRAPPLSSGLPAESHSEWSYGRAVYARAALALESVRRSHGDRRFRDALQRYVRDNAFSMASPAALESAFDAAYQPGFFARTLGPLLFDGARCELHLGDVTWHAEDAGGFETRLRAHRTGAVQLPTWVQLTDAEGDLLARFPWPQGQRTLELVARTEAPVFGVELDPDRALLIDENRLDQHWQRARTPRQGHWTSLVFTAMQAWLGLWGP